MPHEEHPRIRGENTTLGVVCQARIGTSPHTRGKPSGQFGHSRGRRNIPAYAGKTEFREFHDGFLSEHPRIRGENQGRRAGVLEELGTSPHTRGKPLKTGLCVHGKGNIPAYAGKTMVAQVLFQQAEEHPRIRGENSCMDFACHRSIGTSPHTRGKLESRGL